MSIYNYKLMRTKVGFANDADFVTTQVAPIAADVARLVSPTGKAGEPLTVEVVCEYLTAAGIVDVSARGAVDLSVIKLTEYNGAQTITDSSTVTGIAGGRSVMLDELNDGDDISVRLTTLADPGASTQIRVLYRELAEA